MTHDALHYCALHNTEPHTIPNLVGTTLYNLGTSLAQYSTSTCAQHCTILNLIGTTLHNTKPRWHNTAQSWHLVGTILNQHLCTTLHNIKPRWQPRAIRIHCCVQLQTGWYISSTPRSRAWHQDWFTRQQTSAGGWNLCLMRGANVVRSGTDMVKILRCCPNVNNVYPSEMHRMHTLLRSIHSRSVCTSFALMRSTIFYS